MTTPAGWYDDGQGALRWWDGAQWTEHVHAPVAPGGAVSEAATDNVGDPEPAAAAVVSDERAAAVGDEPAAVAADEPVAVFVEPDPEAPVEPQPGSTVDVDAPSVDAPAPALEDIVAAPAVDEPAPDVHPAVQLGFAEPAPSPTPTYDTPTAPGAYPATNADPGGYAGQPAAPGAYAATALYPGQLSQPGTGEPPKKRSLWWIWLVAVGVALVVLIVLALIFIPMAIRAISGGVTGVTGGTPSEDAAVAAVQTYDRAWQSVDCDLMFSVTTEAFREDSDLADCSTFESRAQQLADQTDDYVVSITSVGAGDADATVTVGTSETYTSRFDDEGNDTGEDTSYQDVFTYVVVPSDDGGTWLIDDATLE